MDRHLRSALVSACLCTLASVALPATASAAGPPVANDVSAEGTAGAAIDVTLSASVDFESTLTFSIVDPPSHGSLGSVSAQSCHGTGPGVDCTATVTYTSAAGYNGADNFTYKATDFLSQDSAPATVSLAITAIPVVPADQLVDAGALYSATAGQLGPGATVDYGDGGGLQPLAVSGGSAELLHVYAGEGSFPVTVTNPGPPARSATSFAHVLLAGATAGASGIVAPGGSGTITVPGITATLVTQSSASGSSSFLVATYSPSNPAFIIAGPDGSVSAAFDLRAVDTTSGDRLTATFSYPDLGPGSIPTLRFFNPASNSFVPVTGSRLVPNSYVVDSANHRITIVLDDSSLPSLSTLKGTRFAVLGSPGVSHLTARRCVSVRGHQPRLRLRFALSQAATVNLRIQRRKGSASRAECPRSRTRSHKGRPRFGASEHFVRSLAAGRQGIALPIGGLRPGGYRITVTAHNAAGSSAAVHRGIVILRSR